MFCLKAVNERKFTKEKYLFKFLNNQEKNAATMTSLRSIALVLLGSCLLFTDQMNEVIRNEITTQLGFSNRIDVEGTEYYE